jgi:hypothetical protein
MSTEAHQGIARYAAAGGEDIIRKSLLALALLATIAFTSHLLMRRRNRTP